MTWIHVLGIIFVFLGHTFWLPNLSENKFSKAKTGIIWCGLFVLSNGMCVILGTVIIQDFDRAVSFMFLASYFLFFFSYMLLTKGIFLKKIFLFITYANFFCIIHNVSYLLSELVLHHENAFYHLAAICIRLFLQLGGLLFYLYFMKGKMQGIEVKDKKLWLPICTAGILFFFLYAALTAIGTNVWNYTTVDTMIFLLLFTVTVGLYVMIFYTINCMNTISQMSLIKQQSKYLQEQAKNHEASEAANRRLRHDMRHHLLNIAAFVQAGNQQAALEYIKEYDHKILELAPIRYAKHPAINNILSAYAMKFHQGKIPFGVHCHIPESLPVEDVDLITLLGNLLENALHGCEAYDGIAQTDIYIKIQNEKLIVVCENTCSHKFELEENLPKDKSIGVSSILTVCNKYHGHLGYSVDKGICSACAVLHLPKM